MGILTAYDEARHTLVVYASGACTDADYDTLGVAIRKLGADAVRESAPAMQLTVLGPNYPQPTSTQRAIMAEAKCTLDPVPFAFAMVTDSRVLRGVITAVNWLKPPPKTHVFEAVSTVESALELLGQHGAVDHLTPMLRTLS